MGAVQIETGKPLKDAFTPEYVAEVAQALAGPGFDGGAFRAAVLAEPWAALEFKGRMLRIAEALDAHLPADFDVAVARVEAALPALGRLLGLSAQSFVQLRAAADYDAHWDRALAAIARYTPSTSGEFAVRPFIAHDAERALATLRAWTASPDEHVRRLASEGCRPRLPWAMSLPALKADPTPLLPILTALRDDPSEYVRRSVANNLNDIAKDHPQRVLALATDWLAGTVSDERRRLVKHALRTLLKQGRPAALRLFGFRDATAIAVTGLELARDCVQIGALRAQPAAPHQLAFTFTLAHTERAPLGRLRVEYAIHYLKANGRRAPKVYKLSEFESVDTTRTIERTQNFIDLSTRRHHPGLHELAILVNGLERARIAFTLEAAPKP